MEEEVIISVKIDSKEAEKQVIALTQTIEQQRQELAKQRKALKDSGGENAEAAKEVARLRREIADNNAELRRSQKEVKAEENSINALRASINKLNAQRNAVNTATKEGQKEFARLTNELKEQRDRVNELSQSAGSFRDNVGNYTESVKEAFASTQIFGVSLQGINTAFNQSVASIIAVSRSLKTFRGALIATGIGAFVVVLGSLISFFTRFQEGVDLVSRKLAALEAGVTVVAEAFGRLGKFIVDFVSGTSEEVGNLSDEIAEVTKRTLEAAAAAEQIEKERQQLRDRDINFIVRRARLDKLISEQRAIAANQELSAIERQKALEKANQLVNERAKEEIALKQIRLNLLEREQALGENLAADNRERAELEAEIIQLQTAANNEAREGISQISGLRKAEADRIKREEEARIAAARKASEERLKIQKKENEERAKEEARLDQEILDITEEFLIKRNETFERLNAERVDIALDTAEKSIEISNNAVSAEIANIDRLNDREKALLDARIAREQAESDARKQIVGATNQFLQEGSRIAVQAFGEQSAAAQIFLTVQKEIARAQIIISGISEIQQIFERGAGAGPFGTILAGIQAAAAAARTAIAVTNVEGVQTTGFASGGYTGDGPRYQAAGTVHKGEFVVSKPLVKKIGVKRLSNMTGQPIGGFASGGLADSTANRIAASQAASSEITSVARAVENVKLFVAVKDINDGQQRFANVQDLANQ